MVFTTGPGNSFCNAISPTIKLSGTRIRRDAFRTRSISMHRTYSGALRASGQRATGC